MSVNSNCGNTNPRRTIEFGSCVQSDKDDAAKEPIEWEVLEENEGKALILSKKVLFSMPYNESQEEVSWENCTLRSWLNGTFLKEAFTDEELAKILSVKNSSVVIKRKNGRKDSLTATEFVTEDRVFLLSTDEAEELIPNMKDRIKKGTPYALKSGLMLLGYRDEKNPQWWLRSPAGWREIPMAEDYCANVVMNLGDLGMFGQQIEYSMIGVCPAMWIKV